MRLFNLFKKLFSYSDLRKRALIVISLLLFARILANTPLPDVDLEKFKNLFESSQLFGLINIFSGGALSNFSIALLGLGPYITAIIILQLLTFIYPRLKEMYYEEGEIGRAKFNQYGRILTVPLAFIQSIGFLNFLRAQEIIVLTPLSLIRDAIIVTCGTIILMWLGELITEQKLGNGISLIIFSGIVAQTPQILFQVYEVFCPFPFFLFLYIFPLILGFEVFVQVLSNIRSAFLLLEN